jgi:hypothetical protein
MKAKILQKILTICILSMFFFVQGILAKSFLRQDEYYKELTATDREIAREVELKYIGHPQVSPLRFKGDSSIDEKQYVESDVVVLNGTLRIAGEIRGNVLAIFGDVELESTAVVSGNVISVDGKVWRKNGSNVTGDIVETEASDNNRRRTYRGMQDTNEDDQPSPERRVRKRSIRSFEDMDAQPAWFDYNRVDGWTLGLKLPESEWWQRHDHNYALLGKGGYSFASKRWQYKIGFEHGLFDDYILAIGGEYHNMTDTEDRWIIEDEENSFAAMLLKEDFRDYFKRTGYSVYGLQKLAYFVNIKAGYQFNDFSDLENQTNWSLFGGHKFFRENPLALPLGFINRDTEDIENSHTMRIRSVFANFTIDSRDHLKHPTRGWYIQASGERAGYELDSDMDFERYIIDVRRYQPFGWDENLSIRLRAGTARGVLPPMYWFDLGGISTLRGLPFKEMTGDRMVLGNLEYRINTGDALFLSHEFNIVLFVDSGYAWFADEKTPAMLNSWPIDESFVDEADQTMPKDTFDSITWKKLKTCVGIGLEACSGDFRVDFAKRTDISGKDLVITARLRRPF